MQDELMKKLPKLALICLATASLASCDRGGESATRTAPAGAQGTAADVATAPSISVFVAMALPAADEMVSVPCALDKINAQRASGQVANLEAGTQARFSGWISDAARKVPAKFTIVLRGNASSYGAEAQAGRGRPDVARALKSDALTGSGFLSTVSLGAVPAGEYEVGLLITGAGKPAYCRTKARVQVVAGAG
jgi:hypothetical protein